MALVLIGLGALGANAATVVHSQRYHPPAPAPQAEEGLVPDVLLQLEGDGRCFHWRDGRAVIEPCGPVHAGPWVCEVRR